jgi:hypothetical protein
MGALPPKPLWREYPNLSLCYDNKVTDIGMCKSTLMLWKLPSSNFRFKDPVFNQLWSDKMMKGIVYIYHGRSAMEANEANASLLKRQVYQKVHRDWSFNWMFNVRWAESSTWLIDVGFFFVNNCKHHLPMFNLLIPQNKMKIDLSKSRYTWTLFFKYYRLRGLLH